MSAGQLLKAGTLTLPSHSLKENPWQIVFGDIACSILHRLRGVSDKGYVKRHPMLSSLITCWNLPVVNLAEKYHNFCIFHTKTLRSRKLKDEFKSLSPASLFFFFFFFFFFCLEASHGYHLISFISILLTVKVTQSCPTLCDPMDCTVCGILQTRIQEWVVLTFSQPRDQTQSSRTQEDSLPAELPGKPS